MENNQNAQNNLPPKKAPKTTESAIPEKPPKATPPKSAAPKRPTPPKAKVTAPSKPENKKSEAPSQSGTIPQRPQKQQSAPVTPKKPPEKAPVTNTPQKPASEPTKPIPTPPPVKPKPATVENSDKKQKRQEKPIEPEKPSNKNSKDVDEIHNKNENLIAESIQNNSQNAESRRRKRIFLILLLLLLLIPIVIGLVIMFYYLFRYKPPVIEYNTNVYIEEKEITKQYDELGNEITYLPGNFVYYEGPILISSQLDNSNNYYPMVFRFKISAEIEGQKIENALGVAFDDDSIIYKNNLLPVLAVKEGKNYYTISDDYYFYCTTLVSPNETVVKTVESLYINPERFTNEHANKTLTINVTAESLYPSAAYFDEVWPESEQEYRSIVMAKLENSIFG